MNKKKLSKTTIYLDKELYIKFKVIVLKKELKINDCFVKMVEEFIEKNKKYL